MVYLAGTINYGHFFIEGSILGCLDSDYAGDVDRRKSTTGYFLLHGGRITHGKILVNSALHNLLQKLNQLVKKSLKGIESRIMVVFCLIIKLFFHVLMRPFVHIEQLLWVT